MAFEKSCGAVEAGKTASSAWDEPSSSVMFGDRAIRKNNLLFCRKMIGVSIAKIKNWPSLLLLLNSGSLNWRSPGMCQILEAL